MKNSRKLTLVLLILALGIWGIIGFKIYESTSTNEEFDLAVKVPQDVAGKRDNERYIYINDVRDPFRYAVLLRNDTTKKSIAQRPVWNPPPQKLTGILTAKRKRTAMLEELNGQVHFLHEGDTLNGMRVLRINTDNIVYRFIKRKAVFKLE